MPRGDVARAVLIPFALSRLLVGAALAVTRYTVGELDVANEPVQLDQGLLAWDAAFYADIADGGYDAVPADGVRFFPLVPLLARAIASLPAIDTDLALLVVTNASALGLGVVLYALAWQERADESFARRAVWLAYLLPPAFVLVMGYAESTLMLLAATVLLGARSRRWWVAAAAGYAAGLARPIGALLAVPAAVEALRVGRTLSRRETLARAAAAIAPVAGIMSFLGWSAVAGSGFMRPLEVQEDPLRRGDWRFPVTNLVDIARDAGPDRLSAGVHVTASVILAVLAIVLARRWPLSYAAYAGVFLVLALSASNLDSLERYALSTIPFVFATADVAGGAERERAVLVVAVAGLIVASVLAFTGVLVP